MRAAGVAPDVFTFTALLDAFGKCGQTERAWSCLEDMRAAGVAPTVVTFRALVDASYKSGDFVRGAQRMMSYRLEEPSMQIAAANMLRKARRYGEARIICQAVLAQPGNFEEERLDAWMEMLFVSIYSDRRLFQKMVASPVIDVGSKHWARFTCARVFGQNPTLDRDTAVTVLRSARLSLQSVSGLHDTQRALQMLLAEPSVGDGQKESSVPVSIAKSRG